MPHAVAEKPMPLTMERYLTEREVESILGFKDGTLAANRARGRAHPPFIRFERAIRYRSSEVERWLAERTVAAK